MRLSVVFLILIVSGCSNLSAPKAQWSEYRNLDFETVVAEAYRTGSQEDKYFVENFLPINSVLYEQIQAKREIGLPIDDLVETRKKHLASLVNERYRYFSYIYLSEYDVSKKGFSLDSTQVTIDNPNPKYLEQCFKNQGCHTYIPNDFGIVRANIELNTDNFYYAMEGEEAEKFVLLNRYAYSPRSDKKHIKLPAMYVLWFKSCEIRGDANEVAECQVQIEDVYLYGKSSVNEYDKASGKLSHL